MCLNKISGSSYVEAKLYGKSLYDLGVGYPAIQFGGIELGVWLCA